MLPLLFALSLLEPGARASSFEDSPLGLGDLSVMGTELSLDAKVSGEVAVFGDRLPWGLLAGHRVDWFYGATVYTYDLPRDEFWAFSYARNFLLGAGYAHYFFGDFAGNFHTGLKLGVNFMRYGDTAPQGEVEAGYVYGLSRDVAVSVGAAAQTSPAGGSPLTNALLQLVIKF